MHVRRARLAPRILVGLALLSGFSTGQQTAGKDRLRELKYGDSLDVRIQALQKVERFWYGGYYVAVFNRDFSNLRFCSYVPGCSMADLCETPGAGVAYVGRSVGADSSAKPNPSPVVSAIQPKFAGGRFDAHIILLHKRKPGPAAGGRKEP